LESLWAERPAGTRRDAGPWHLEPDPTLGHALERVVDAGQTLIGRRIDLLVEEELSALGTRLLSSFVSTVLGGALALVGWLITMAGIVDALDDYFARHVVEIATSSRLLDPDLTPRARSTPLARELLRRKPGGFSSMASRKYGKKASEKIERAMHEMKRGTLRSGGSGKQVKSRKQAIAIGLSEARRAAGKVPAKKSSRRRRG
jgi:hypothetical protein